MLLNHIVIAHNLALNGLGMLEFFLFSNPLLMYAAVPQN